ncbi:MAG: ABC transporter permease, partial [Bacteroidetes bacterium]|nr:ABC transporter permease [Bacteroidota bacterium]
SYNNFNKNLDRIFLVAQTQHYKNMGDFTVSATPTALGPYLKSEYPEVQYATRYTAFMGERSVSRGEKSFNEIVKYADPDFFNIFSFDFLEGSPQNALTDPHSVVVTKETAEKLFGTDDVLGKTVRIDVKHDFKITGVIQNIPDNSDISFDLLAPMQALDDFHADLNDWGNNRLNTYVLLRKGIAFKAESRKIKAVLQQHVQASTAGDLFLFPFKDYHLYSISGSGGRIQTVRLFSLIALITLLIACINFMNLATARASKRSTEVGIKKVVGANRHQIATQFFGEALLLTVISLVLAMLLAELFLPAFSRLAAQKLSLSTLSLGSILVIVGLALAAGVIAGVYPAIYLSSFTPFSILRKGGKSGGGQSGLRRLLVVVQFSVSIFLIVCTLVVTGQLHYLISKNLGFDKQNIVYFPADGNIIGNLGSVKSELLRDTEIRDVSCASNLPFEVYENGGGWSWPGKNPKQDVLISFLGVDYGFTKAFDIRMAEGRFFSKDFPSDTVNNVVINETFARIIGKKNIVGTVLTSGNQSYHVVGVMKDFNFTNLLTKTGPLLMYLSNSPRFVFVKISRHLPEVLGYIKKVYAEFNPGLPLQYHFLDETYERSFEGETRLSKIFNDFSVLAIIISCLGLFGLASFVAEQRTKEIGIRKVLGASSLNVVKDLTFQFMIWVIVANLIAWPTAYYYINNWLQGYPYRINLSIWLFALAGFLALFIAGLTVSFQAIRAATTNPVESLRYE